MSSQSTGFLPNLQDSAENYKVLGIPGAVRWARDKPESESGALSTLLGVAGALTFPQNSWAKVKRNIRSGSRAVPAT